MKEETNEVKYPKTVYVEAVLMANGEVIHYGKTLGFISKEQENLVESGKAKLTKSNEVVVAVGKNVA